MKTTTETPMWPKTVNLSDGRTAEVAQAKGKHVMKATKMSGGQPELMQSALLHALVTIDGKAVPMEEFEEMPAGDFMALLGFITEQITPQ